MRWKTSVFKLLWCLSAAGPELNIQTANVPPSLLFYFQENKAPRVISPPRAQIWGRKITFLGSFAEDNGQVWCIAVNGHRKQRKFHLILRKTPRYYSSEAWSRIKAEWNLQNHVVCCCCTRGHCHRWSCLPPQLQLRRTSARQVRQRPGWHSIRWDRGWNGPFNLHILPAGQHVWVGTDVEEAEQNIMTGDKQQPVNVWTSFCNVSILNENLFIWGGFFCFFFPGTSGSDWMDDF